MSGILLTSDAGTETVVNGMETIISAASDAITFSGTCLTAMISNPVYAFFLGAGLVGVGLSLIRKLRHTAA